MDEQDKQVPENEIQEEAPPIDPPSKDIDREQEADAKNDVETTGVSKRTSDEDKLMPLGLKIAIGVGIVVLFIALFFKSHLICFHSDISPASCTNPPICKTCGKEMGEPSGHSWRDATCTDPKTCKMCGKTEGEALGHKTGEWTVSKPATCTEKGEESSECSVCKSTITRELPMVEHTPGEWTVSAEPELKSDGSVKDGVRIQSCTVCGKELNSETYTLSAEELAAAAKNECAAYSFDEIARNPDEYNGKKFKTSGKVVQVLEEDGSYILRVNMNNDYNQTIMVVYKAKDGESRILENDIVTLYGTLKGVTSYKSVLGSEITLPLMRADYKE